MIEKKRNDHPTSGFSIPFNINASTFEQPSKRLEGYFKSAEKDRMLPGGEVVNRDYHGTYHHPSQGRCKHRSEG